MIDAKKKHINQSNIHALIIPIIKEIALFKLNHNNNNVIINLYSKFDNYLASLDKLTEKKYALFLYYPLLNFHQQHTTIENAINIQNQAIIVIKECESAISGFLLRQLFLKNPILPGTMNLFFLIDDTIITAPLGDTVLDGVTRDSIIVLANKLNLNLEVRKISIGEVISSIKNGKLKEAFGAGTAATVAPIKTIGYESKDYDLPEINLKSYSSIFLEELNNIKYGKSPDLFNWITKV